MSRKEKAIITLVGEAFGARLEVSLAKYERTFTAKENKEVKEDFKIGDEEAAKDIIELYDGTEKSINDAAERIKKDFIDIALKETTDSIKKTMNSMKTPTTKKRKQTTSDGDKKAKKNK
jgi:hypothetical protein